jgi:putative aldouronate transport system substrate-binding protein
MKRTIVLILSISLIFALFAGCGGKASGDSTSSSPGISSTLTSTPTSTPGGSSGDTGNETDEPVLPYAAGKFLADANGLALEKYEYPLPLTTSDEVITIWTSNFTPDYLPEEGFETMPFPQEVLTRTGVHVEYFNVPNTSREENFAVRLASDDLLDIMCQAASYYNGPIKNAVLNEGYFVNLYDYRMYMPNYIYEVTKDPSDRNTIRRVFVEDDLICLMYELRAEKELSSGAFARGDWLEDMGKINTDIKTFDDLHDMLAFFKTEKDVETPMTLLNTLELAGAYEWVGFDTYCCCSAAYINSIVYVIDGKVRLSNIGENDLELMTMINQWFSEGLIDPNWTSYASIPDIGDKLQTGEMGYIAGTRATTMKANDSAIPEGERYGWVAMTKPVRYEGQTLHMGFQVDRVYWGSAAISSSCENIELAVTWLDWRYSEEGSFLYGYGVQGESWDYDENGNIVITDFICDHPAGWTMIMLSYALNSIVEPGLYINYAWNAPGNEIAYQYTRDWEAVPHDDAYVYPSGISYTDDQNSRIAAIASDLGTYLEENYLAFVDGSKPLSEWDSYVAGAQGIGLSDLLSIYQEAYDAFMAA